MPDRSRKRINADPNLLAKAIVDTVAGEGPPEPEPVSEKQAAARLLGRLGGLKGGKVRAAKLSKDQLSEIGRKAVNARWHKGKEQNH